MSKTPEGRVKEKIREVLKPYCPALKYFMPVPYGIGASGLDFHGCFRQLAFVIEAKAAGKQLTPRQIIEIESWEASGAKAFVIVGEQDLCKLETWLKAVAAQ